MSKEQVKSFIDNIADDKYSDAKEAVQGAFKEKFEARITDARGRLGLVKPEVAVDNPIPTGE